MSWNSSQDLMLQRLNGQGEDLLYLDLDLVDGAHEMHATRIAAEFNHRIDAAMVGNKIYVVEHGPQGDSPFGEYGIFEVTLPATTTNSAEEGPEMAVQVSGFPNPFCEQATLRYTLQRPAHVTAVVYAVVYDVLGREVATLVDGWQNVGQHTTVLDGTRLPGGLYVCRVIADGKVHTLTMVRVR